MSRNHKSSPLRRSSFNVAGMSTYHRALDVVGPLFYWLLALGIAVGIAVAGVFSFWIGPQWILALGSLGVIAVLISLKMYEKKAMKRIDSYLLGYKGEQTVGDALDELKGDGYRVIHDLPLGEGISANIDHVAVGPGGVFAIETKARSKGHGEEIEFNGTTLRIGGREFDGNLIGQTLGNARRVRRILEEVTGHSDIPVQPALVFAGRWFINDHRPSGQRNEPWVLNEQSLTKWICKEPDRLSIEDVNLYAKRLQDYVEQERKKEN